jgi:hypothetical protein
MPKMKPLPPSCVIIYKKGNKDVNFIKINARLRSGRYGSGGKEFAKIDNVIGQIISVINGHNYTGEGGTTVLPVGHKVIQPNNILYRGIKPQISGIFRKGNTPKLNEVYEDKGFLSTSTIYSVSRGFAMPHGFFLTITIRNAANVIDFSRYCRGYNGEGEILFDRNTRIVVDNAVWNGTTNLYDVACHIG